MKQSILFNGQKVEYELLQRSNARSIKVRVVFGKLKVSAPVFVSIHEIEKFLLQNQETLIKEMEESQLADYQDHGFVYLFGHKLEIIVRDLNIHQVVIKNNQVIVYHHTFQKDIESFFQKLLVQWIQEDLNELVRKNPSFFMPQITYKRTSGRYGACYYTKNRICFNPVLIHYKKEFIHSVVIHEMCHFIYHDHSSLFYLECEKYMTNYKEVSGGKKVYD